MKSLLKRLWKGKSKRSSSTSNNNALKSESEEDLDVPVMKVLGSRILPRSLVDTAHLSILNHCAEEDGVVVSITLRLGATPPGDGMDWEARIYEKSGPREFVLKARSRVRINIRSTAEQEIALSKPLPIKKGQYIGLTNRSGRLSVTYTRGWAADTTTNRDFWDLWYQEIQPSAEINGRASAMLLWNGRVGWYASMQEDPPEPMIERIKSTMGFDIGKLWHDKETADVVFEVGHEKKVEIQAHKIILKARSRYFAALLAGGFAEGVSKAKHIVINDTSPEAFTKVLEWLYTNEVTDVHAGIAAEVLQAGSRYCLDGLVADSEIILKEYVNAQSVGEIYQLANDTNANQLLDYCKYYARKHTSRILQSINVENASCLLDLARYSKVQSMKCRCEKILRQRAIVGSHSQHLEPIVHNYEEEKVGRRRGHSNNGRLDYKRTKNYKKKCNRLSARSKKLWGLDSGDTDDTANNNNEDEKAKKKEGGHGNCSGWLNDEINEDDVGDDEEKMDETNTQQENERATVVLKSEETTAASTITDTNNDHTNGGNIDTGNLKSIASVQLSDESLDDNIENNNVQVVGRERLWSG
jgi:hypothetical protein